MRIPSKRALPFGGSSSQAPANNNALDSESDYDEDIQFEDSALEDLETETSTSVKTRDAKSEQSEANSKSNAAQKAEVAVTAKFAEEQPSKKRKLDVGNGEGPSAEPAKSTEDIETAKPSEDTVPPAQASGSDLGSEIKPQPRLPGVPLQTSPLLAVREDQAAKIQQVR